MKRVHRKKLLLENLVNHLLRLNRSGTLEVLEVGMKREVGLEESLKESLLLKHRRLLLEHEGKRLENEGEKRDEKGERWGC